MGIEIRPRGAQQEECRGRRHALCKKIAAVHGVGPITATAIVGAIGDAKQFRNQHPKTWFLCRRPLSGTP
ncbi:transposase [Ralstonia sp. SET104]|uniref:transposase n=1 Tax=Ralstonia sp. SET104 TaxID=2448774 RepID=UPI000FFA239E|nr:hypothetical protein PSUB009319_29010 [Ralstonia sp. SET104]